MKTFSHRQWLGLAAVIIVGVVLFWKGEGSRETSSPARSTPAAVAPSTPRPPPAGTDQSVRRVDEAPLISLTDAKAAVHLKLRQWAERKTGDTDTENRLMEELLALLTDDNAAELTQVLSAEERNTPFGLTALERWLKGEPAKAARWIAAQSGTTEPQALLVARALLKNPADMQAYCDGLPDGDWKQSVLKSASLELAGSDPAGAINLARHLNAEAVRTDVLQTVTYDWITHEPRAALDWITRVNDPALREGLYAVGAKAIAATDPDLAAGWLVTAVKSEKILNDTALSIIESWTAQDPAKAAKWVALFPAQGPREAAVNLVVDRWLQSDPNAANAWLLTLPERDKVLARLKAEQDERERPPDMEE
ncbi:MAG TPA: hypothetical protein VMC06_13585 [Opitutaceae bacterium]|nr:hypothetical protein [Opitutaceae bacterium]